MKLKVRMELVVDSDDASWVPTDGIHGVEDEAQELIIEAIEQCVDGTRVKAIGVKVYD